MAAQCRYEDQLAETSRLVAEAVGQHGTSVVYQSRSGSLRVPWLEPDVSDRLRELSEAGVTDVVVSPVGFVSDHMEVLYDLDVEAAETARGLGLAMVRAGAAGTHPAFVAMIRELIQERLADAGRRAVGRFGPGHEVCPVNCCLPGTGNPSPWDAELTAPV
jgi:ferrochelatase